MSVLRSHVRLVFIALLVSMALLPSRLLAVQGLDLPLSADAAVHMGHLHNGVAYWVRSHATPPGKIAFWMHVATGSVNEADGQEGLAHYLEHMAFNGTQNFPPGELVTYFESIGLRFGQHQNAFTSFNQTTYVITLPDTHAETIDKGLLCLADFAFRMLLTAEEVDKERRVIIEEKRAHKGVGQRLTEKLLPQLLPTSRVARRLPIGLEETITRTQRRDLLAYYTKWYHPSKVTILAVGDAPVETIVAAITKHFAPWQRDDTPPDDYDYGIQPYTAQRAIVVTDPELTTASVEALSIRHRTPRKTVGDFRRRLIENLGMWIVNRRMQQLVQEGKALYQTAQVYRSSFFNVAEQFSAEAEAEPASWSQALQGLMSEIQRARVYGFTAQEFADARKAVLAGAEHAAQTEATRDARGFLRAMNRALAKGELPRSAAQNLQLIRQLLPDMRREEMTAAFTTHFAPDRKAYVLSLPEKSDLAVPSDDELLARVKRALSTPVEPWQVQARPTSLLTRLPLPGAIVEQTRFAPLGVTHVTFENNIRLHYRFMDFKKDHVTVTMTLPGGKIRERPDNRGITNMATLALSRPATGQFSSTAIRDFMTGKKISVGGGMMEDALTLTVSGTPEALEEGLQLAHLLLRDARIEAASVELWKRRKLQALESFHTRTAARTRELADLALSGNDLRRAVLTPAQIRARAAAIPQAQAWLDGILRSAPMEVAIVGDIPEAKALRLAAMYLGSLPPRPRYDASLAPLRQVTGFTGPLTKTVDVETITPRARVILMWRCAKWQDVRGRRLIHLAARILERRLREEVREKRGLTYATSTYVRLSKSYPDMSTLYVQFTTDPDKVTEAVRVARSVVETFAAAGPTPEEVATVRKQLQNSLGTMLKRPGFWVGLLTDLEYHGTQLTDVNGLVNKIMAFSQADIAAEIKKTVIPARFVLAIGHPKAPATLGESVLHTPEPAAATP